MDQWSTIFRGFGCLSAQCFLEMKFYGLLRWGQLNKTGVRMSLFNFTGNAKVQISGDRLKKRSLIDVDDLVRGKLLKLEDTYHTGVSFQLEACRLSYKLPSLRKSPYPEIEFADNLATKMAKISDVQANHPFIELNIFHKKSGFNKEDLIASIALQNKGVVGYADLLKPYLTTGDVKLLGVDSELSIEVDANTNSLTSEDWLQIECDYTCVISGIEKPKKPEPEAFDFKPFWDNNILQISGGFLFSNPQQYPNLHAMAEAVKSFKFSSIRLRASNITSLGKILDVAPMIKALDLDLCRQIESNTFSSEINQFVSLQHLATNSANREGIDFGFLEGKPIVYFSASSCSLAEAQIEQILTILDSNGREEGSCFMRYNAGLTTAATAARDNLVSKGWSVSV